MKVLFTGGGTAGHVTPNVALIEAARQRSWEVLYVGSHDGIEREIMSGLNVDFRGIASGKLRRYFDWQNFVDPLKIMLGWLQSFIICLKERPDVVFSKGGFVAVPVVYAAWLCRIPVIGHESDITPGLANRLCIPLLRTLCVNFPETRAYVSGNRTVVTGTPLRASFLNGDSAKGRALLGLSVERPILLVFGGSLGAARINRQVRDVLPSLLAQFQVVHITGAGNLDTSIEETGYVQREFLQEEFGHVIAAADLVVARAGANSIYELLVLRKPHLLIPLPAAASRGDQIDNARTFSKQGYSTMLLESELSDEVFLKALQKLHQERNLVVERLARFERADSVTKIMSLLEPQP